MDPENAAAPANPTGDASATEVKTETAAPAAAAAAPADKGTVDSAQPTTEQPPAAPIKEDWADIRARIAGDDEKLNKRLSRYSTLDDYIKAGYEAQNKLSSIKAVTPPTAESTPEEVAEYRKAMNVPENPDGYDIKLPDGLVLGDADKPIADKFMAIAHKNNLPGNVVNEIIAQQLQLQEEAIDAQLAADAEGHNAAMETLRSPEVWGSEFNKNRNMINNLLNSAPNGVGEMIQGARLPDGSPLADNVDVLVWLNGISRTLNPTATLTDGNRTLSTDQMTSELNTLKDLMGDHNSKYWKGAGAPAMQARFLELTKAMNPGME